MTSNSIVLRPAETRAKIAEIVKEMQIFIDWLLDCIELLETRKETILVEVFEHHLSHLDDPQLEMDHWEKMELQSVSWRIMENEKRLQPVRHSRLLLRELGIFCLETDWESDEHTHVDWNGNVGTHYLQKHGSGRFWHFAASVDDTRR